MSGRISETVGTWARFDRPESEVRTYYCRACGHIEIVTQAALIAMAGPLPLLICACDRRAADEAAWRAHFGDLTDLWQEAAA